MTENPVSGGEAALVDTLTLGYVLGATPCTRDFHPLERAHAERTKKNAVKSLPITAFSLFFRT